MRLVNRHDAKAAQQKLALDDRDQGVVLVWVALMLTTLLGVGALVIDLGALYVERRELQNGADAAALAVAQSCSSGSCGSPGAMAKQYADLNAKDGSSAVDQVCGVAPGLAACAGTLPAGTTGASGWVRVDTSTLAPGGGREVPFVLAPVMDAATGATKHASAIAAWGSVGRATTVPLIFGSCEFREFGGVIPPPGSVGTVPTGVATIYFHSPSTNEDNCFDNPSGQDGPGGFGWLSTLGNCLTSISAGGWVSTDPGNSTPPVCDPATWHNPPDQTLVIAIYDQVVGTGSGVQYHILGFAGFTITGYALGGNGGVWSTEGFTKANQLCTESNGGSGTCIRGTFTSASASADDFGGPDLGVTTVKMIG